MRKVVIKISQGSIVTQTMLGGLTIHLRVANFLCFISAKNYENWLKVGKFIAMNTVCSFFGPPCSCGAIESTIQLPRYAQCDEAVDGLQLNASVTGVIYLTVLDNIVRFSQIPTDKTPCCWSVVIAT